MATFGPKAWFYPFGKMSIFMGLTTVAHNGNTQIYIILLHSISQYTNIFIVCASIFTSTIKYTPVQQYASQYRHVNFSTKIETPVQNDISHSQYTNNSSSKKNINLSVQKHKFRNKHIHRLCDQILQYSKIHVYNSTTIFIPVQKYKSQYKNKSCGTKN